VEGVPGHGREVGTRRSLRSLSTSIILLFYESIEKILKLLKLFYECRRN